jgi:ferric-dicitrate binding protein FerR (iron transport regulator)
VRSYHHGVTRRFVITWFLSIALLSLAETPPHEPVIVTAGPSATVDAVSVSNRMAAFEEQVIETHTGEVATLTSKGNTVKLLGHSKLKVREPADELISGGAWVSTTARLALQSDCYSVRPTTENGTRYSVFPYEGKIHVEVEQGEVVIKTRRTLRVTAGKGAVITSCGQSGELVQLLPKGVSPLKIALPFSAAVYPILHVLSPQ